MNIKISVTRTSAANKHLVLIADHKLNQLKSEGLTDSESDYVKKFLTATPKRDICMLNRYDYYIFIIRSPQKSQHTDLEKIRHAGAKCWGYAKLCGIGKFYIKDLAGNDDMFFAFTEGLALSSYEFLYHLTDTREKVLLRELVLVNAPEGLTRKLESTIKATFTARDLANEPVSHLSAEQLSARIGQMAKEAGFKFEFLNKKKIQSLKMGGLLGVNQGSVMPPTFNILEYKSPKAVNKKPVIYIGKGVTFDTGGVSLKPAAGMDKMKSDMSGAAAVACAIYGIALEKLPVHVIGLIPATDNRIGSNALVPGDIITTYSGKTVEVLNTDAEGRLILSDALHYAKKYNPRLVIDLATLTGSAMMAIGEYGIVAMEKDAGKAYDLLNQASEAVYERLVKFPLWEEYDDLMKSPIADLKNIGGAQAGAITAGKFLEHFTDYPWVHLDLSNAIIDKTSHYRTAGGTGAGTRLLMEFARHFNKL